MEQLIDEMKSELLPFSKHLFNAQWQSKQFEDLKAHIPEKHELLKDDFGFEVEKHFFGSRHGKGPCDGESGVVKRSATVAVAARGCIISNAQDFYLYAKKQLSLPKENDVEQHIHSKRTFFFIKSGDVVRNRPERTTNKTLKQSRSLFSYRGIQPYVTTARERSCFCHICIGQAIGVCQFEKLTGKWKVDNLKIRERRPRNQQTGDVNNAPDGDGVNDAPVEAHVGDVPGDEVGDVPGDEVGDVPGEGVGDAPGDEIGDAPGDEIGDAPGEGVGDEVGDVPGNGDVVVPKHQEFGNQSDNAGNKIVVHTTQDMIPFEFDESFNGMMAVEISFNDSEMSFNNSMEIESIIEVLNHNTDDENNIQEKKSLTGLGCNISQIVKKGPVMCGKLMTSVIQLLRKMLLKHWQHHISRCVGAAFVTHSLICRMGSEDTVLILKNNKSMEYLLFVC
ncbi:unnamed protein product [Mytilus coruscus]|uniref:Uncharacterized protein n=1 Tax=Mytilus coruscus TaxID=42192 RepID=A0A6J8DGK3_MYTCO|nr:unnamed protein product [Mytilus coruscus]